jgi:hypothetical protein
VPSTPGAIKGAKKKPGPLDQQSALLNTFGKYGGFGGLALFVFLNLFSRFGDFKAFFGHMDADQTYRLIMTFMILTFALCIFGLACWVYVKVTADDAKALRTALLTLLITIIYGGAMLATRDQLQANITHSLGYGNAPEPPASVAQVPPPERTTQRLLAGSNFGFQVGGCQSLGKVFSATAPGEIDGSKGGAGSAPPGFDLEITGNNGHGVRNIQVDGNTIRFEAYADGPGTQQPLVGCVGAQGANVNVNVYAYVKQ